VWCYHKRPPTCLNLLLRHLAVSETAAACCVAAAGATEDTCPSYIITIHTYFCPHMGCPNPAALPAVKRRNHQ
jgi:hypothetical protein